MKEKKDHFYDSDFTKNYVNLPITFFHYSFSKKKDEQAPNVFIRRHNHEEIELLYFKQGSGFLLVGANEEKISFQSGDLFVINPLELHKGYYDSSATEQEHLVIDFSPSLIDMPVSKQARQIVYELLTQKIRCQNRFTQTDPGYQRLVDCFLNIYKQTFRGIANELSLFSYIFSFFSELKRGNYFRSSYQIKESARNRQFIADVLDYIELHYSEEITTQNVAESVGYSTGHFCRLFKELFNTQFTVYLMKFRIEKAKQLLSLVPISEISERCGFSSQSNFARAFRKITGVSPTDFKRNGQTT